MRTHRSCNKLRLITKPVWRKHQALREAVAGNDKDAINSAMEALNTYSAPLAHRAMDVAISDAMKGKQL